MPPYKHMYFHLFNAITDALQCIDANNKEQARKILMEAQRWGEDTYIEAGQSEKS